MRTLSIAFLACATVLAVPAAPALAQHGAPASAPASAPESPPVETDRDQLSYAIGLQLATSLRRDGVDVNLEQFMKAMEDVLQDRTPAMSPETAAMTLHAFQRELEQKRQMERMQLAQENLAEGQAYMTEYSAREDVTTLPSGLAYRVIQEGWGPAPKEQDEVRVNYRGTLLDGTEFDSSYQRGEPAQFGVTQVIMGWREALQLMPTGAQWELVIPAQLAYGPRGAGDSIPPNATLIFEVELLEVIPKDAAPAAAPAAPSRTLPEGHP